MGLWLGMTKETCVYYSLSDTRDSLSAHTAHATISKPRSLFPEPLTFRSGLTNVVIHSRHKPTNTTTLHRYV